ncbi:MAG TPA: DUF6169 family protein [Aequorivita sp.]|nr:DUF6169 family protein [Aequorivita sp.]
MDTKIYKWNEKEEYTFEIITDNFEVYNLIFKTKDRHFTDFCQECRDVYEIDLRCSCFKPKRDEKVKNTIIEILKEVLSNRCDSLVYLCDDSDFRASCRELLFDKWYDENDEQEQIEKFVKSRCTDEETQDCLNMYFIADKNRENYEGNVDDFFCEHT